MTMKPTAPPHLSKEMLIVWETWSLKDDRKVVRESAAKGHHIGLALTYLSQRKLLDYNETKDWFNKEVLEWSMELLQNKQVFRVSHILKNINLDPMQEISKIFQETVDSDLRDYLGKHLENAGKLDETLKESWQLLLIIEENFSTLFKLKQETETINILLINNKSLDWKHEIVAELFLKNQDFKLQPLLNNKFLWEKALNSHNYRFICKWIDVIFSENIDDSELGACLNKLKITTELIDEFFMNSNIKQETKSKVCNKLAQYGMFCPEEQLDAVKIISRLTDIQSLHLLRSILSNKYSNMCYTQFLKILYDYCESNELYGVLDICTKDMTISSRNKQIELIETSRIICENPNDKEALKDNLMFNINYLQEGSTIESLIVLFVLILSENNLSLNLWDGNTGINFDKLPVLKIILNKFMNNNVSKHITMYDLAKRHLMLDTKTLFQFQFDKEYELPYFNQSVLVNKYGYKKSVDCKFYLSHCRPSVCKDTMDFHKLRKFTIQNFSNKQIVSSCIAYLEMRGEDSDFLRHEIFAANILHSNGHSEDKVIELFLYGSKFEIMEIYENILCGEINLSTSSDIIDIMHKQDILIKFAELNKLNMPEVLLMRIANKNLWLPFLIIIQKYNYTQEHVARLVQNFTSVNMIEHLSHCLMHDIHWENKSSLMKDRDSRKYYLSKIGVRKNIDNEMVSSITSQSSYSSTSSSTGISEFLESENFDAKCDLLQVLIKCHNSNDPPKALLQACQYYKYPLFAVLATSYEPDSVITNWLVWLSVSCNMFDTINFEHTALMGNCVSTFIQDILRDGFHRTLLMSFHIFLPKNPLKIYMSFICDCINFNSVRTENLEEYFKLLKLKRSSSVCGQIDHDMMYLQSKDWIENTSIALTAATLQTSFLSYYRRIEFMETLVQLKLENYFTSFVPNFQNLLKIFRCLCNSQIVTDFDFIRAFRSESDYKAEIFRLVDTLSLQKLFDDALEIALIENIMSDSILVRKWENNIKNSLVECDEEFEKFKISPERAVSFFEQYKSDYEILKLAYKWAYRHNLHNVTDIEKDYWLAYLNCENCEIYYIKNYSLAFEEISPIIKTCELIPHEQNKLSEAIDKLLEAGEVYQAFQVGKLFNYFNNNLEILKVCLDLAEGITLPFQLTAKERLLMKKVGCTRSYSHRRRPYLTSVVSSYSSQFSRSPGMNTVEFESNNLDSVSQLIENLIENLKSGLEVGQKILMTYRISVNVEKSYRNILELTNPMNLLLEVVNGDCVNKLEVIQDFSMLYKWNRQQIADFLCEQIILTSQRYSHNNVEMNTLWGINLDNDIHVLLQLLPDTCTLLGNKLYYYASALLKVQCENPDLNEISHIIELLIRAHDCYTSDCNMEGISIILKKCQTLFNILLTMNHWNFIIRLLTGIARYAEMNYVFHILRENGQFENLLRKGKSKRDNGLKVALLEYLKRFCPDNRDLYNMVALHFSLYSEVAQLWEVESESILRNLIAISKLEMQNRKTDPDSCLLVELTNTEGTKICLTKAMENYSHAAEFHMQGEKLAKAMNAARQAELIALQFSLLKNIANNGVTICLINLNTDQISSILLKTLSFPQALILSEAYNYQVDWAQVLFKQFIMRNQTNYLVNFVNVFNITEDLAFDISRKFLTSNLNEETALNNMKIILKLLPSVHAKYRIASELGFIDLVEELLNGNRLIYLKDTVWKRGYNE
ncbi:PREDICTED: spatacsin [Nicrophorus vespilloides]|uniref:Spatacsin n=1 Tax=Nicrophorus vespilloides TaxID=110193 RepID=A0ABM1MKX5_NICVS|nr:PREDICTED: spatacsin [Nicrophorus vespilloides]